MLMIKKTSYLKKVVTNKIITYTYFKKEETHADKPKTLFPSF